MKKNKVVICGSVSLQIEVKKWLGYFSSKGFEILDYPRTIDEYLFSKDYPKVYKNFFLNIDDCNYLFIMNEDKKSVEGYIGAETFAELAYGVVRRVNKDESLKIVLLKMPSRRVQSYEEVKLWLELGWIELLENL